MKKSTLVVLLLAAALGGYIYYSEFRNVKEKPPEDAPKPLYTFTSDDIASIRVTRPGESAPLALERRASGWVLTSPVETGADRTAADTVAGALARAASSRRLPVDPARMKEFGLDPPAANVEFKLKSGQSERLELGAKDFSEMNVYARQGGAKEVLLVPDTVFTEVTRQVNDLRDRAVLHLDSWSLTELDFHTAKAKFQLEKKGDAWEITEPRNARADADEATSLGSALSSARFSDVAEEQASPATGARYGLSSPTLALHARNDQGAEASLLVGKNDGNKYFARDAARSMVFRVEDSLVKKFLDATLETLRDKHLFAVKAEDFSQLTIRNPKQTMSATLSKDGKWLVDEPADRKGKEFMAWHVFEPLTNSRATEVVDQPGRAVLAKLDKPAVEIKLTDKKGGVTSVVVSDKEGTAVYARSTKSPLVFKFDAYLLTQLSFGAADAAP